MLSPPLIPAKTRRHRKRRPQAAPPAPPVVNQIVGVAHGATAMQIVVTVSGPLVGFTSVVDALTVSNGFLGIEAVSADLSALPLVTFTFAQDASNTTEWTVPNPAAWQFAGGAALEPPTGGVILG